ncbi:SAVED domain-containing protein [Paraburkholderia strydomiana]|uniref:SAVED domain-containing protein n=1 Tax=Paraburkholderia strydomiana TaxID=1245417 RepID=A0ABW9EGR9_9BURK
MSKLDIFSDVDMADAMKAASAKGHELLIVANGFTAVLATRNGPITPWTALGRGDFGLECGAASEAPAGAGRLWWQDVTGSPAAFDVTTVNPVQRTKSEVKAWLKVANALTTATGRGDSPSNTEYEHLGYLAAWRCQFSGCGKDLKTQTATGAPNKSSYFAHIIASSPNGPRGDSLLSDQRSADIENFLLLCDECHRRIDREDPDRFTISLLQKMREQSIAEVRRLLGSLQYKEAIPVVVMGNISTQSPHFVVREAEEAMWTRKLRMKPGHPYAFFENGWNQHDPHSGSYWSSLFNSVEAELPQLRKLLRTDPGPGGGSHLAVFPLHGTSVLMLAGRLFGEASAVSLFQFRRERPVTEPGGRWAFDDAPASSSGKFFVRTLEDHTEGAEDACLIVSLTFSISPNRLPTEVAANSVFKMGALEVSSNETLHHDILSNEGDLDLISQRLGEAVRVLQDDWRVKRVHVFIGAPASVCFKLGQKLQARNQAIYRCYESEHGASGAFLPTIEIDSKEVRSVKTMESLRLT